MKEKLKKLEIKGFIAGVVLTLMLTASLVWANTGTIREVFYGVNIVINGNQWNPPSDMVPFITEGRTFLPVRGIADVLGVPVDWHGPTGTVYVGTVPQGMPFFDTVPHFQESTGNHRTGIQTVRMMGNAYPNSWTGTHAPISGSNYLGWRDHNLNNNFNTLTGVIGRVDGSGVEVSSISFIGDGRTLATFEVDGNSHPIEISVDVRGVLVLRTEISYEGVRLSQSRVQIAFTNAMIQ